MSDIWIKKSNTNPKWAKAIAIHIKRYSGATTKWFAAKVIWIKNTSQGWLRVWPTSGVFAITDPYITTTASGSTPLYGNQTVGTNDVIRIGTTYYGRNGTWDPNGFSISSYSYSWPYYSSSDPTINYDELGSLASGVYASPSQSLNISSVTNATATDGNYISFRITANASNSLYSNTADSKDSYGKIKVIRRTPQNISYSLNGEPAIGQTLSFSSSWNITEAYKPNASRSTIKWYKVDDLTNIYSSGSRVEITRASNSYSITLESSDNVFGKYIIAEETVFNTGSDYDIGENQFINGQNQVTAVTASAVGVALSFSNVAVKDYYGQNGLDNRGRWPTGTLNQYTGQVNGYDANTTLRIRYRVYNFDTGLYWKPSTGTQTTASAAWDSWNSDGSGNGYISNVSVNNGVATFYDYFSLDETYFNGGGSGPTWWLEIELSALKSGGTRTFYNSSNLIPETYYISKRIDPTVSVSPSTVGTNENVTISGAFAGFPATPSTNAYPRQYIVYYGDGTNSGYLPIGEYANGTINPTYSLTKQYSTGGTYTITVRAVPFGTDATAFVTVAAAPGAFSYSISDSTVTPETPSVYSNTFSGTNISYDWPDTTNTTSWQSSISGGPEGSRSNARTVSNDFWPVTAGNSYTTSVYSINDSKQATISWTSSTGAGSYYVVYINNGAVGTQTVTGNSITVSTTGLVQISSVRAYANADGTGLSTLGSLSGSSSVTPTSKTSGTRTAGPDTAPTVSYTVTWNANGGSVSPTSSTGTSGSSVTAPTPTRSGYSFNGWYNASSGGSFIVGGGSSYTLSANVTLYAQWTSTFTPPSSPAPSWSSGSNFSRKTTSPTHLQWFTDYPSISGDGSFTSMQFEIRTTAGGGTLLASGTRAFPGYGSYPYSAGGTIWAFRMGTTDGDITYSSSARYGRVRTVMTGTNGSTYYGTWSAWI